MISGGLDPLSAQQTVQMVEQVYGSGALQELYGTLAPSAAQVADDFGWMSPPDIARSREVFSPATLRYAAAGASGLITAAKAVAGAVSVASVATAAAAVGLAVAIGGSYGYASYSVLNYYSPDTTDNLGGYINYVLNE